MAIPEIGSRNWFDSDPDEAASAIVVAIDRIDEAERALRRHLRAELDLGETDVLALELVDRLNRAARPARVSDISRRFGISSGAATEVANRLERRRLLLRVPDPDDLRARELHLTDDGAEQLAALTAPLREDISRLLADISEEERERIVTLLTQVGDLIRNHAPTDAA